MTVTTTGAESPTETFSSKFGFILATAGSAIGLANIWKFPYVAGKFGGGTFIAVYLFFLIAVGFPAFISEILIGKNTTKRPEEAFTLLGRSKFWKYSGRFATITGFIVTSFYSVVAGWVLGYFFETVFGQLAAIETTTQAKVHLDSLLQSPIWTLCFQLLFYVFCIASLTSGVKKGLERCNIICLPLLFILLLTMLGWATTLPTASSVVQFLTTIDLSLVSVPMLLVALGHSFFTLSIGQGTLTTYGSYLKKNTPLLGTSLIILLADTFVSLAMAFCLLSVVFFAGVEIQFGPELIFQTLPSIFSTLPFGGFLLASFFFLIFIAALTSQISAIEPMAAHLTDRYGFSRKKAIYTVVISSFLIGIPCALSTNLLSGYTFFGQTIFDIVSSITTSLFIPVCGLLSTILVGRKWGLNNALNEFFQGEHEGFKQSTLFKKYFCFTVVYSTPTFILIILLHSLGLFGN